MKLADKLDRIKATAPNRSAFGQLYKSEKETVKRFNKITLYVLFISDEATHLLRNHVFVAPYARTPAQWHAWFGEKVNELDGSDNEPTTIERLTYIHEKSVLPGIALRTAKSWAVRRIIGWVGGVRRDALSKNSAMARKRHKTKSKRAARG